MRVLNQQASAGNDRWLISYSDFITLLFALFVVLFAFAYRDRQSIRTVSSAIHHGFDSMGAFSEPAMQSGAAVAGKPGSSQIARAETGKAPAGVAELRRQLEVAMGKELRDGEVLIHVTPEGFVVSLKELGFFNSGDAVLLPGAAEKIKRIATVLMNHGLEVRVEGHSDNQPIHNREFRSNWELSTARAMTVLLLLVNESHFDPNRISIVGYGEYHPVGDNSTAEGRRMNRRVDLVVVAPALDGVTKKKL
ncbi:cell envelope biogenesis protein OmpA [Acidobacteria bacterium AB60]|nr:cell envelope biogenesis protein OmpA [Acidobacteria bacterium AB60]